MFGEKPPNCSITITFYHLLICHLFIIYYIYHYYFSSSIMLIHLPPSSWLVHILYYDHSQSHYDLLSIHLFTFTSSIAPLLALFSFLLKVQIFQYVMFSIFLPFLSFGYIRMTKAQFMVKLIILQPVLWKIHSL